MNIITDLEPVIWILIEAGSLLVCLATLAGFMGRYSWVLDLFSHFRLQYLILLLAATGLFILGERYPQALACGLFAGINLLLIVPLFIQKATSKPLKPGNAKGTYRVLLANVLQNNDAFGMVRHLIRSEEPDFIVLIEVNKTWYDQLRPALVDYPFKVMPLREDNYGIALFSRFPMKSSELRYFGTARVPSILASFQLQGRPVTILATHPPPPKTKLQAQLRNIQIEKIAEFMRSQPGEALLVGDLNMTSWSPHFKDLIRISGLRDSRKGFGLQKSWPTDRPLLMIPIDHILVSPGILVQSRRTGQFNGSDHYPVIMDFTLSKNKEKEKVARMGSTSEVRE
jgi:endonuclease/exonuclease/phosphatase (EEP) superfamily protein YafD